MSAPATLDSVLAEFGVEVIPPRLPRRLGQTHAEGTFRKLFDRHGADHIRDVLTCILESDNNRNALVAPVIKAVSRMLLAHRGWYERDASTWLAVFDETDLLEVFEDAKANRAAAGLPDTVATELFRRLRPHFESDEEPRLI